MPARKPVLQAIVLADHIHVDQMSSKTYILGTFNQIFAKAFPSKLSEPIWLFISLTEVTGQVSIKVQFRNLANYRIVRSTTVNVESPNKPRDTLDLRVRLRDVPLPEAGLFAFEVVCEEELLGSLRVRVEEIPQQGVR